MTKSYIKIILLSISWALFFTMTNIHSSSGKVMITASDGKSVFIENNIIMQAGYFSSLFTHESFLDSNEIKLDFIPSSILIDVISILKIVYSMKQLDIENEVMRGILKKTVDNLIKHRSLTYISYFLSGVYALEVPFLEDIVKLITCSIAFDLENRVSSIPNGGLESFLANHGYSTIPENLECHIRYFFSCKRHSILRYIEKYGQPKIQGGVLDLSGKGLISLEGIDKIEHLERVFEFDLSDNKIIFDRKKNPVAPSRPFQMFRNLEVLTLSSNSIKKLPHLVFFDLHKLNVLFLDNNLLSELDESLFSNLENIIAIYLDNNNIKELPEKVFNGLHYLRGLYLRNNRLKKLPESLFNSLHNLIVLHLSNNNLYTLPKSIFSGLYNLHRLIMGSNLFTVLPTNLLDGLSHLELLYLGNTRLLSLPENFFEGAPNLQRIYLHGNRLMKVASESFSQNKLPKLQDLDISHNYLSDDYEKFAEEVLNNRTDVRVRYSPQYVIHNKESV